MGVVIVEGKGAVLCVNMGASHVTMVRGGDRSLLKLLWDFLFLLIIIASICCGFVSDLLARPAVEFDGDPAIFVGEEAICAYVYRLTDRRMTHAAR